MSSWEEQESYWNSHLERLASEVGLDAEKICAARQQLIVIFGEEWLKESYGKIKKFQPGDAKGVVGLISNPIVNNAVEAVELAIYLRAFSGQHNFNEIITKLRNTNDFEAIRLNLAFAYRLKQSGWEDIYVEPALGDIEGTTGGIKYVIECSMIVPPKNASKTSNEIFRSIEKVIKRDVEPSWVNITLNPGFTANGIAGIIKQAKSAYREFIDQNKNTINTSELGSVEVCIASKADLDALPQAMEDCKYDYGWHLTTHKPKRPGDIYSVDLDEEPVHESGIVTIKGVIDEGTEKTTLERLREKLKRKKAQTKNVPDGVRRMFVFMSNGMVENENWQTIGDTFAKDIKRTENIDAIVFLDRRHQEFNGKLRYPSGQVHFFTSGTQLSHLEKSFALIKAFEDSDWLGEA